MAQIPLCCGCGWGAAAAPIQPLARELPYATGEVIKSKKKKKKVEMIRLDKTRLNSTLCITNIC